MRYERKILVPYLETLFHLELTVHGLAAKWRHYDDLCSDTERYIKNYQSPSIPSPPKKPSDTIEFLKGFFVSAIFLPIIIGAFLLIKALFADTFEVFFLLLSTALPFILLRFAIHLGYGAIAEAREKFEEEMYTHQQLMDQLKEEDALYHKQKQLLPHYRNISSQCSSELSNAKKILEKAYRANIIPSRYRNLYAVSYLYEYFNSSNANDLDMIIQTLLLDNIQKQLLIIQQKLDQIISNQQDMLYELQGICQKAERIEQNSQKQLQSLARQERNQELQSQYLSMIESNTAATAYFSAATCYETMRL